MLAQKLGLSLPSTRKLGGWVPANEDSCAAHYKYNSKITYDAGNEVSLWKDQTANINNATQDTAGEFPLYDVATGAIDFDGANDNLLTTSQITIAGEFIIGCVLDPEGTISSNCVVGDNTTSNYWIRLKDSNTIQFKLGGSVGGIDLDLGNTFDGKNYLVFTRNSADLISVYFNGTKQVNTLTLAGSLLVDALGIRATDVNDYRGLMYDVSLFSSFSAAIITNLNDYLAGI